MVQPFTINLHLPNAMRVAIGDVTAQWSFLEYQIGQIIHQLLKLDPKQGRIVTTQLNLRPQLEMIDLLFSTNKTDELIVSNFHKISDAIAEMQPERNMVVHGLWSNAKGSTEHHLVSYHGKKERRIVGKAVPMTETKIRYIAANTENINLHLGRMIYALRIGEFPPYDGKLPTLPRRSKPIPPKDPKRKKKKTT